MDATFLTKRHGKGFLALIVAVLSITIIFSLIISFSGYYRDFKAIDVLGSNTVLENPVEGVQQDTPPAADPGAVNLSEYE